MNKKHKSIKNINILSLLYKHVSWNYKNIMDMSTVDIRQELKDFINQEDDTSLEKFYKVAKAYIEQRREDKLMAEAEEDIKEGRVYTIDQAQKIIDSWDD